MVEFNPTDEDRKRKFWQTLDRIDSFESWLDGKFEATVREYTYLKSDMQVRQKTLRLFFRYQFIPASATARAHFLVIVDGLLLDPRRQASRNASFLKHVQSIRFQLLERRPGLDPQTVEWSESTFPEGSSAQTLVARFFCEKSCSLRVTVTLHDDGQSRFELPDQLRRPLSLPQSLNLDELCLSVLGYAHKQNLLSRDRKFLRCDDNFKEIFGVPEVMAVSSVRQRLTALLSASQAQPSVVAFDMAMAPNSDCEMSSSMVQALSAAATAPPGAPPSLTAQSGIFTGAGGKALKDILARTGGKVMDFPVADRDDLHTMSFLQELHSGNVDYYDAHKRRRIFSLLAAQAGKEASLDQSLAQQLCDLSALVQEGDLHNKATVDDNVDYGGVLVRRSDVQYLGLLPPLASELIARRHAKEGDVDIVRAVPSALHGHGGFRSSLSWTLRDGHHPAAEQLLESAGDLWTTLLGQTPSTAAAEATGEATTAAEAAAGDATDGAAETTDAAASPAGEAEAKQEEHAEQAGSEQAEAKSSD